jgi:hypothetical protein
MRRLSMIAGFFSVACGFFLIWMAYGFASMVDPGLPGAARRAEILRNLLEDGDEPIGLGILLIGVGIDLAWSKPRPAGSPGDSADPARRVRFCYNRGSSRRARPLARAFRGDVPR